MGDEFLDLVYAISVIVLCVSGAFLFIALGLDILT